MRLNNKIRSTRRTRSFHKSKSAFASICSFMVFVLVFNESGNAQIAADGFNGSTTLFTRSGGAFFSGTSTTNDRPASSPFFSEGSGSVGVTGGGTITLTTTNSVNTSGFSGIQLSFRLAAFGINSTSNGVDISDNVVIEISTNGGSNYSTILTVNGASAESGSDNDVNWAFSATGVATTAYPTAQTFTPSAGGGTKTDAFGTVIITSLPATTTLKVRITMDNNQSNERWLMDDFKISGTAATPTVSSFTPGNGCANTVSVNITGTNFTGATAVKFGGTNAFSFTVNSATQVTATPATGSNGVISVTTPNGTGSSVSTFTVHPNPVAAVNGQDDVNCFGGADGSITIEGTIGTGPYNYSVDGGTSWTSDVPALANPYTYGGLTANQAYRIKVRDIHQCVSK